jgi:hypothetical protein
MVWDEVWGWGFFLVYWAFVELGHNIGSRLTEPKNRCISVPENQELNRNRFSQFRFFRFQFPVLSVRFPVLGFCAQG